MAYERGILCQKLGYDNDELCVLVEYVHRCLCTLVNLVDCVLDDVLLYLYTL